MLFTPRYRPCPHCGDSLDAHAAAPHVCSPERLVDFAMFSLREGVSAFMADLQAWVSSPRGRFAQYLAARAVRRA